MTDQQRVALQALQSEINIPITLGLDGEFISGTTSNGKIYISVYRIEDVILLMIQGKWSNKKLAHAIVANLSQIQILTRISDSVNLADQLVSEKFNKKPIDLNDPRMMDTKEASEKWNIDPSYIRQHKDEFPVGSIRKFGKQIVVTEEGMYAVFGSPRGKKIELGKRR